MKKSVGVITGRTLQIVAQVDVPSQMPRRGFILVSHFLFS